MTGGIVTVLGAIGINFGAGMTGGFAYLLDENGKALQRLNTELVEGISLADQPIFQEHLRGIIHAHFEETGSLRAEQVLSAFEHWAERFILVKPAATDLSSLLGHRGNRPEEILGIAD